MPDRTIRRMTSLSRSPWIFALAWRTRGDFVRAGAVGANVGQIAKIKGCRAVGVAGGPEKCTFVVDELGFDACIDHRADDFEAQLAAACPDGVDIYFENVAGRVLEAVIPLFNFWARMPV